MIVAFAIVGFIFNSGVLWNEVSHIKKNINKIWQAIDEINKFLRDRK